MKINKSALLFSLMALFLGLSIGLGYKSYRTYNPKQENLRIITADHGTKGARSTMYEVNTRKTYYIYSSSDTTKRKIVLRKNDKGKPILFSGSIKTEVVDQ